MKDMKKLIVFLVVYMIADILPVFIVVDKTPIYIVWVNAAILTIYLMSTKQKKLKALGIIVAFIISTVHLIVFFLSVDHERMILLSISESFFNIMIAYVIYRLINNKGNFIEADLYKIVNKIFFRVIPAIAVYSILEDMLYSINRMNVVEFGFYNFLLPNFLGYVLIFSIAYIIFKNKIREVKPSFRFYIFFVVIFFFNIQEDYFNNVFNMNRSHIEYISIFILVLACIILKPEEFIFLIIEDFTVSFFMVSFFLEKLSSAQREYLVLDLQLFYAVVMATCFFLIILKSENKRLIEEISIKNKILKREVKENKEMLQKVTLLIDSIKNTAFIADENGKIVYSNNEFKKLINVHNIKNDELLYNVFHDLKEGNKNIIREEISIDDKFIMQEIFISSYDNRTFISGIGTDITGLKKIQDKLEKSKKMAEEANRAKTSLISRVSHELKTPMNTITAVNFLLSETKLDSKQKKYVKKIDKSSEFLLKMIEDILFVSKVTSEKIMLERNKINFLDMIQTIIMLEEDIIRKKGIKFIYYIDENLPKQVLGDELRIKQILINIISNSVKFTKEGYIKFIVQALYKSDGKHYISFVIEDTGIGISEENKEKIFEPFTQEDESITRKYGGTGIGLSICKNLIKQINGKITLESEKGVGSKFNITIPFLVYEKTERTLEPRNEVKEIKEEPIKFYENEIDKKIILKKLVYIEKVMKLDLGETIDKIEEFYKEVIGSRYEIQIKEIKELIDIFKLDEAIEKIDDVKKILIV